jgi:hypothetical protein
MLTGLQKHLTEFKDTVTEELNNQSDMLTDITNNLQVGRQRQDLIAVFYVLRIRILTKNIDADRDPVRI